MELIPPQIYASQQPGKPKPPGNLPNRPVQPDPEKPLPIEDFPGPIPAPVPRREPPPMQVG